MLPNPTSSYVDFYNTLSLKARNRVTRLKLDVEWQELTADHFEGYRNLQSLILAPTLDEMRGRHTPHRETVRLSRDLFKALPKLSELHILMKGIEVVEEGAFRYLPRLHHLNLYGNRISEIERGALGNLRNLACLKLDSNRLTEIPRYTFSGLAQLTQLVLDHNRITKIEPGAFSSNGRLVSLSLRNNRLHHLQDEALRGLKNLWNLNLEGNPINPKSFALDGIGSRTVISFPFHRQVLRLEKRVLCDHLRLKQRPIIST